MGETTWEYREEDKEFFYRELDSFVPNKIFDAHCHLHESSHMEYVEGSRYPTKYRAFRNLSPLIEVAPHSMTLEEYHRHVDWLHRGREVHSRFMRLKTLSHVPLQ